MIKTTYVTDPAGSWDLWVGPGPCPRTGRRFGATRWKNPYHAEAIRKKRPDLADRSEFAWLLDLLDRSAVSRDLDQIRENLVGLRLGTSREAHGLLLARLADSVPVDQIRAELLNYASDRARLILELEKAGFKVEVSSTCGTLVYSPAPARALLGHVTDSGAWRPVRIPIDFAPLSALLLRLGVPS